MRVVLDASAAVRAVIDDESAAGVFGILREASAVLAPDHFIVEVTSGLWKYVTLRGLPVDSALWRLAWAARMVRTYRSVAALAEDALLTASAHLHPVYDAYYAVLARRENAGVLTLDKRLKQLCNAMGVAVVDA